MNIKYNRTGDERKALVKALSEIIGMKPKYKGAPCFAYEVGGYTVDRDGTLTNHDGQGDPEAFERIVSLLSMKGFDGEMQDEAAAQGEYTDEGEAAEDIADVQDAPTQSADEAQPEPDETPATDALESSEADPQEAEAPQPESDTTLFALQLPLADMTDSQLLNLQKLIASKASLIKKSFGIDSDKDLSVLIDEENEYLVFPWLDTQPDSDTFMTCMRFVSALRKTAKTQKRILGTEREVDSEKFAFRIFLLRLGFGGAEFAEDRKRLLKNLSGNAAFPNDEKAREHTAKWKEKRQQEQAATEADTTLSNQPQAAPEAQTAQDETEEASRTNDAE